MAWFNKKKQLKVDASITTMQQLKEDVIARIQKQIDRNSPAALTAGFENQIQEQSTDQSKKNRLTKLVEDLGESTSFNDIERLLTEAKADKNLTRMRHFNPLRRTTHSREAVCDALKLVEKYTENYLDSTSITLLSPEASAKFERYSPAPAPNKISIDRSSKTTPLLEKPKPRVRFVSDASSVDANEPAAEDRRLVALHQLSMKYPQHTVASPMSVLGDGFRFTVEKALRQALRYQPFETLLRQAKGTTPWLAQAANENATWLNDPHAVKAVVQPAF